MSGLLQGTRSAVGFPGAGSFLDGRQAPSRQKAGAVPAPNSRGPQARGPRCGPTPFLRRLRDH